MEQSEVLNLWKSYDKKVEEVVTLNKQNTTDILRLKAKSVLAEMNPIKLFTLFVGIGWVVVGGVIVTNLFLHAYDQISLFFLYSAVGQLVLTAIATVMYGYQLIMIQQINIADTVIATQKKLSYLKGSTLWSAKILFLQLPFWTTFYLSQEIIASGNITYIIVSGFFTALFALAALWIFVNINHSNKDKKWFKWIFSGKEWDSIITSIEFYKEIERYQKN